MARHRKGEARSRPPAGRAVRAGCSVSTSRKRKCSAMLIIADLRRVWKPGTHSGWRQSLHSGAFPAEDARSPCKAGPHEAIAPCSPQRVDKVPKALCRGYALTHWSNGKPFSRPFVRVRKRFLTKSHENRRACRRFSIKSRRACGPSDASLGFVDGLSSRRHPRPTRVDSALPLHDS